MKPPPNNPQKTICLFGIYDPTYARNRVLMTGFKQNGYTVTECRVDPKKHPGLKKFWHLFRAYRTLPQKKFDHVIVAFPGHSVVWLAYLLFGRAIIFDAFLSLYNSEVEDRKTHKKQSFHARYFAWLDWISAFLPKTVLLDTEAHIDYFAKRYKLPRGKFVRVFVGTTPDTFFPQGQQNKEDDVFRVHFHGTFIPLQGIQYILEAAKILESDHDTSFRIVGSGQEYRSMKAHADEIGVQNIEWTPRVSLSGLNDLLAEADVVLGVFGNTPKTQLVIPNKIYEGIAAKRAVLTADTPAIRELFTEGEDITLCAPADAEALAEQIKTLKDQTARRHDIAENGHQTFQQHATPKVLVAKMLAELSK